MKENIEKAFTDFDKGVRPDGYKPPRHWYVLSSNGQAYPAKAIWALATKRKPGDFYTKEAKAHLSELDYSLIDTRVCDNVNITSFENDVIKSLSDTKEKRLERLSKSNKKPPITYVITKTFKRNPDVVAEVLLRANGVCETCKRPAPFKRKTDKSPYLEVHHRKPLANDGDDTVENSVALCPNCHRQAHFGEQFA